MINSMHPYPTPEDDDDNGQSWPDYVKEQAKSLAYYLGIRVLMIWAFFQLLNLLK